MERVERGVRRVEHCAKGVWEWSRWTMELAECVRKGV